MLIEMPHCGDHGVLSFSGRRWIGRFAAYCLALFFVAILWGSNSAITFVAASSHVDSTSSVLQVVSANPVLAADATQGDNVFASCAQDEGAPRGHTGMCDWCCSISGCGGAIVAAAATVAEASESLAQFSLFTLAAPRNLQLPPITRPPISPFGNWPTAAGGQAVGPGAAKKWRVRLMPLAT